MHLDRAKAVGRIDRFLDQYLPAALIAQAEPLEIGAWTLPGEPVPFAEAMAAATFTPVVTGHPWGAPWETTWLRVSGTIPATWPAAAADRRIELSIDLGFNRAKPGFQCEGLVRTTEGHAVKGLEPRNHHVPVTALPGESVTLYVEAASNPDLSGGNDFANPLAYAPTSFGEKATAPRDPLYRLGRVEARLVNTELESLGREMIVLRGLLAELSETDPRRMSLLLGLGAALDALDPDDPAPGAPAARAILAPLLASPAAGTAHRIVATGHAHIDSAWLWPTRETIRKCVRTFSGVLDLMDRDDDVTFTCSSAQHYDWVRRADPVLFERLRMRVAQGRFIPVGNMWVESDVTMPSGESLARQLLYGARFFEQEFGARSDVGWLPDSFGYPGSLPQLLRKAGLRWFFTQKMCWNDTNPMPHHSFLWEGIDGSRVFTHFPPVNTYSGDMRPTELARSVRNYSEHGRGTLSLMPFGYGDGGGGPTREMMADGRLQADLEGSPRLRFGTPGAFFAAAEAEYAEPDVWSGEMYLEFHRGIFTSQSRTKRGNRRNERLLVEAELWSAAAVLQAGLDYPYDELDELWRAVLLLQFHDILPGTAIAWVHREAEASHAATTEHAEAIIARALAALLGEGDAVVAVNPAPVALGGVPARGGAVVASGEPTPSATASATDGDDLVLTSSTLRVRIAGNGTIVSLVELASGREVLPQGRYGNLFQLHHDVPTRWDAWDLDASYRNTVQDVADGVANLLPDGRVHVAAAFGDSAVEQWISLDPALPQVRIRTAVDWHERHRLLKLAFPLDVHAPQAAYETQFGHVTRPIHTNTSWDAARYEVCAHRWVHVAEPGFGAAVANDGIYGHDVTRQIDAGRVTTTVRQSLLRAPTFPDPHADQGLHEMVTVLAIAPTVAEAIIAGHAACDPMRHLTGARAPEPLAWLADGGSVVLEAIKLAADRSGDLIVRLYESAGARSGATLHLNAAARDSSGLYGADGAGGVREVDLVEHELAAGAPAAIDSVASEGVRLTLRPFEVVTLRFARSAGGALGA